MKRIIVSTAVLFLAITGALAFTLFYTSVGIDITVGLISRFTVHQVSVDNSSGRLLGRWELTGVRVRSAAFEASVDRLAAGWHPVDLFQSTLKVDYLHAAGLEVNLIEAQSDPVPRSELFSLPELSLPLALEIDDFKIEDLSLHRGGKKLLAIDRIALEAAARNSLISISELALGHPQFQTSLEGTIVTSMNWPTELSGTWKLTGDGCGPIQGEFDLNGTADEMGVRVSAASPGTAVIEGKIFELLNELSWELDGAADLYLPDLCAALNPLAADLSFHTKGRVTDYLLQVDTELVYPDLPDIEGSFSISGNEDRLVFERSTLSFDNNDLEFSGQFSWENDIDWELSLSTAAFDFSHYQKFADGHADLALTSAGSLADGRLRYTGTISRMDITIEEPALALEGSLEFQGDETQIDISGARLAAREGLLELDGRFNWSGEPGWQVSGRFDRVNPAEWAELPAGLIRAEVLSSGSRAENGVRAEATLSSLSGEFAGYPVAGEGSVEYLPNELIIRELFLRSGPNSLAVDGTIAASVDLNFSVDGQDLALLHERLEGSLEMEGTIRGDRQSPQLDFSAGARNFSFDDYRLGSLEATAFFDQQGELGLTLAVDTIQKKSEPGEALADTLDVDLSGNVENHGFTIEVLSAFGDLALQGTGQVSEMSAWSGTFQDLSFDHPLFGLWRQQEPARAAVSPEAASFLGFCLAAEAGGGCVDGSWSPAAGWEADLSALRFDAASLERWDLLALPVRGELRGALRVAGKGTAVEGGEARFYAEQIYLGDSTQSPEDLLHFTDAALTLELEDQVLQTSLRGRSTYESSLEAGLTIEKVGNPSVPRAELPLAGTLEARLEDLSRLALLTEESVIPEGRINAALQIGGVLGAPELSGRITLDDGGVMLPDYGLHLQEIAAELQGRQHGLEVKVTARSGEGRGAVEGQVNIAGGSWEADLSISGEELQLLDQRELRVAGNPELTLFISPEGGALKGTMVIPRARIEPEEMSGSDTISPDTQFVDETAAEKELPVDLDLLIELGDDIKVKGYGFEGYVSGAMNITRAGAGEMRGRGQIEIENGTVTFMGRTIDISRGILLFGGSPIDNPGLDIQARRVISREQTGATEMVVGLNITGSVQDYYVELFSDPPMEEREIIAALLLGRPLRPDESAGLVDSAVRFMSISGGNNILGRAAERLPIGTVNLKRDESQGNVSLAFSRQITDRLSAGYDVNLFDNQGMFRVRYSLPRGFSLEVRNSVDITGIELLYHLVK